MSCTLWCYMMYVMLPPYLLHEIDSRNTSLMGSNLIADGKNQLYFVYMLSEEPVTLSGGDCYIHLVCQNFKNCFWNVLFRNKRNANYFSPWNAGQWMKNKCGHDEVTPIFFLGIKLSRLKLVLSHLRRFHDRVYMQKMR